jgi:predicted AAA+ superfamily ATPase
MPTSKQPAAWADQNSASQPLDQISILLRIADALDRIAPKPLEHADLLSYPGYVWDGAKGCLDPVPDIDHVHLSTLVGIEPQKEAVLSNLRGFVAGVQANHMLLWGARGTGKSSLTKAVHAQLTEEARGRLAMVEVPREHIGTLSQLLKQLATIDRCFLLFCDDLSFDDGDAGYKSLKAILDGGIRGCPKNILLAVTSNRRHLLRRDMIENERSTAIHASEAVEEKVSLADRFGLSLDFYNAALDDYLAMVKGHLGELAASMDEDELAQEADNWARQHGVRSGRVAVQFARHVATQRAHLP